MHSLAEPVRAVTEHETFGERLRKLRRATGCTVGEIAAAAGMWLPDLVALEADGLTATYEFPDTPDSWLGKLARVYGVSLEYLWTGITAPTTSPHGDWHLGPEYPVHKRREER